MSIIFVTTGVFALSTLHVMQNVCVISWSWTVFFVDSKTNVNNDFFLKDVLLNSSFNMFGGFSFLFYFLGACSCNGHSDDML